MRVPREADPMELERLIISLAVLVDLRADAHNREQAQRLCDAVEAEVRAVLGSPSKHRDWRAKRFVVLRLLTELDQLLHYRLPDAE